MYIWSWSQGGNSEMYHMCGKHEASCPPPSPGCPRSRLLGGAWHGLRKTLETLRAEDRGGPALLCSHQGPHTQNLSPQGVQGRKIRVEAGGQLKWKNRERAEPEVGGSWAAIVVRTWPLGLGKKQLGEERGARWSPGSSSRSFSARVCCVSCTWLGSGSHPHVG